MRPPKPNQHCFAHLLRGLVMGVGVLTIAPLPSLIVNAAPQRSAAIQSVLPNSLGAQPKQAAKAEKDPKLKRVEEQLQEKLTEGIGVDTTVTCPESTKLGTDFDCEATAEGKTFQVAVTNFEESGAFEFSTKGLVRLAPLEEQIQTTIKEKSNIDVIADCSEGAKAKVRIVKAGETFICKVNTPSGETKDATVNVEDEKGNVKWKI